MFTDELIWGLESASEYFGVRVGLAGGRSTDAARLATSWSWLKLAVVHESSLYYTISVNFGNHSLKKEIKKWIKHYKIKQPPTTF